VSFHCPVSTARKHQLSLSCHHFISSSPSSLWIIEQVSDPILFSKFILHSFFHWCPFHWLLPFQKLRACH
jgi:hypothetical protein